MKDKSPWIQVPLLAFQQQVLGTTYPPQVWRQSAVATKSSPRTYGGFTPWRPPWRIMAGISLTDNHSAPTTVIINRYAYE